MTFVIDTIVGGDAVGDVISLSDGYVKEQFTNANILLNSSIITYICINI